MTFVDVGANVGYYTAMASSIVGLKADPAARRVTELPPEGYGETCAAPGGNDEIDRNAAPSAALAPENVTVPKSVRSAYWQVGQSLGDEAIHSAEALAASPVWVVEKVHPSLLCNESA